MYDSYRVKEKSSLVFILKALIPYTEANLMLAFKPSRFFYELEKISKHKRHTLEVAMRKAEKQKLIELKIKQDQTIVQLTKLGQRTVRPFVAEKLGGDAKLMIIFDIPEEMVLARVKLRRVLRAWRFEQVQKSVWVTSYNHVASVNELINELNIKQYVLLYECAPVK